MLEVSASPRVPNSAAGEPRPRASVLLFIYLFISVKEDSATFLHSRSDTKRQHWNEVNKAGVKL